MEEDSAVAATLAIALDLDRGGELDVQLGIAELLLGVDTAALADDFHVAVHDLPGDGSASVLLPSAEIFTVEQDGGIARRRCAVAEGRPRSDLGDSVGPCRGPSTFARGCAGCRCSPRLGRERRWC